MKSIIIALIAIVAVSCTDHVKFMTDHGKIYQINDFDGYTMHADTVVLRFFNCDDPQIYSVYKGQIPEPYWYKSYYDSSLVTVRYERAYVLHYSD